MRSETIILLYPLTSSLRGREITFGTALGDLLHHRRKTSPNEMEKLSPGHPGPHSGDSLTANGTNGTSADPKQGNSAEKDVDLHTYVWWGKPMWHDLGYCAVSNCTPSYDCLHGLI